MKSLSRVRLLATPWTVAYQAPPSMGFSRQEYWSGVPLPSPPGDLWASVYFSVRWGDGTKLTSHLLTPLQLPGLLFCDIDSWKSERSCDLKETWAVAREAGQMTARSPPTR